MQCSECGTTVDIESMIGDQCRKCYWQEVYYWDNLIEQCKGKSPEALMDDAVDDQTEEST